MRNTWTSPFFISWHSVIRNSRLVIRVESFAEDSLVFSTSKRVPKQGSWVKVNIAIAAFCLAGTRSIIAPYTRRPSAQRGSDSTCSLAFTTHWLLLHRSKRTSLGHVRPDLNSASSPSLSSARRISAWKLHWMKRHIALKSLTRKTPVSYCRY